MVVDARGDAVDGADEGALAAADHAEPDPSALVSVPTSLDGHGFRLLRGAAPGSRLALTTCSHSRREAGNSLSALEPRPASRFRPKS